MSSRASDSKLVLGGEPRVELLPPEVKQRERSRETRRILALMVVLSLVLVGGGYAWAQFALVQANERLGAAQAETASLIAQQEEFREVSNLSATVDSISKARTAAASKEILWHALLESVRDELPDGAELEAAVVLGQLPWAPELATTGPLRSPRVAQLTLIVTSEAIPQPLDLSRALARIPGYADSTIDGIVFDDKVDLYATTITLNVGEEVLSRRFAPEEQQSTDTESGQPDASASGEVAQ